MHNTKPYLISSYFDIERIIENLTDMYHNAGEFDSDVTTYSIEPVLRHKDVFKGVEEYWIRATTDDVERDIAHINLEQHYTNEIDSDVGVVQETLELETYVELYSVNGFRMSPRKEVLVRQTNGANLNYDRKSKRFVRNFFRPVQVLPENVLPDKVFLKEKYRS